MELVRAKKPWKIAAAFFFIAGTAAFLRQGTGRETPGEQADGRFLITTNQHVSPNGVVRRLDGARPKDLAIAPNGSVVAVLCTSRVAFFRIDGTPDGEVGIQAGALGVAWTPNSRTLYASAGNGTIHEIGRGDSGWTRVTEHRISLPRTPEQRVARVPENPQINGLAVSPDGRRLFAAAGTRNMAAAFVLPGMEFAGSFEAGIAPYHIGLSPDGNTLAVCNRGGEEEESEEGNTADSAGSRVRVDPKTDAALAGSLTLSDALKPDEESFPLGRQPAGMTFTRDGSRLYVASSDDDSVRIVDVIRRREIGKIDLRPPDDPGFGQIPTACALSTDEKTLYVACGGANAVAVVNLSGKGSVQGYIPAGWYPSAIAQRNGRLVVTSSKGIGSRPARPGRGYGVHSSVGTVQFIDLAEVTDLGRLTRQVAENNKWGPELPARSGRKRVPIPERLGEPSVFKHVVYIIKENHTYDLDLGDMREGNGDPNLCLFGEKVTPNGHTLAREFVLLDNTYTSGTNSADGHQWVASSIANGYIEQNYNAHIRSYPYDGGDPLAYSSAGFLWNSVNRKGKSLRVYGEFVNRPKIVDTAGNRPANWTNLWQDYKSGANQFKITAETDQATLRPFLHPNFIGFPGVVSDQWRADQFLKDLDQFEKTGRMPSFVMMLLPNDHTAGTRPGMPTPRAAVADGDLALGRIIDRLSHSRFWKEMLILVIMDDSQMGVDHVDGHRTVAYIASPYTRRKTVISQMYNHTSFARTIGLVLGFPALTRFDRSANPLTACFVEKPDFTPFVHKSNQIPLDEMNPRASSLRGEARRLAEASERLDWSDIDRADAVVVAKAVWHATAGGRPFPWEHFSVNPDER
jgi:DNA-binding beta-propeller fold protein YncE